MDKLFYGSIMMIIIMIGLGFANRIWMKTGNLKISIYAFFAWGMIIGDNLALWCEEMQDEYSETTCDDRVGKDD